MPGVSTRMAIGMNFTNGGCHQIASGLYKQAPLHQHSGSLANLPQAPYSGEIKSSWSLYSVVPSLLRCKRIRRVGIGMDANICNSGFDQALTKYWDWNNKGVSG